MSPTYCVTYSACASRPVGVETRVPTSMSCPPYPYEGHAGTDDHPYENMSLANSRWETMHVSYEGDTGFLIGSCISGVSGLGGLHGG